GLGIDEAVSSPTFTLVHEYRGRLPFWHVDAYRLRSADEAFDLGLEELARAGGVLLVEWPEQVYGALPADRIEIEMATGAGDERRIASGAGGARARRVAAAPAAAPAAELPEARTPP